MQTQPRRFMTILRLSRPLLHVLWIVAAYYAMILLRQSTDLIPFVQLRVPQIDRGETMRFALSIALLFVLLGIFNGVYELFRPIHSYYKKFLSTRWIRLITSSFIAYMWFGFLFASWISRFVLVRGALLALLVLTLLDTLINQRNASLEYAHPYTILLLGDPSAVTQRVYQVLSLYRIYQVTLIPQEHVTAHDLWQYEIVMVAWNFEPERLQELADGARVAWKQFYHVSDTFFLEDLIALPQRIWPMMALEYVPSPLDGWWRVSKRLFDLFVATIAVIFLLPILLIVAICIKLDSSWPVFYLQMRMWKNKKPFTFIKFRTMFTHLSVGEQYWWDKAMEVYEQLIDSDANTREWILPKIQDDPRVTRVGRFLRKTSLDELPSLFSVIKWDMSLVGPRPHMTREVKQYDAWQERLFSIKPWITWYAQLFGRDQLPFEEEARLDLYYIQNWSLFLDVYVLVSTVKVVLKGR